MSVLPGFAADDGFKAPAEWDVHEQTWMGFPQVEPFYNDAIGRDPTSGEKMPLLPRRCLPTLQMRLHASSL